MSQPQNLIPSFKTCIDGTIWVFNVWSIECHCIWANLWLDHGMDYQYNLCLFFWLMLACGAFSYFARRNIWVWEIASDGIRMSYGKCFWADWFSRMIERRYLRWYRGPRWSFVALNWDLRAKPLLKSLFLRKQTQKKLDNSNIKDESNHNSIQEKKSWLLKGNLIKAAHPLLNMYDLQSF